MSADQPSLFELSKIVEAVWVLERVNWLRHNFVNIRYIELKIARSSSLVTADQLLVFDCIKTLVSVVSVGEHSLKIDFSVITSSI